MAKDQATGTAGKPRHDWHFFRAGGFDQPRVTRGSDVAALPALDQKLWVALACPVNGMEFDETTLKLIDTDQDGRVRAPEIIAATQWAAGLIKNHADLANGRDSLALSAINDATPEGQQIRASAKAILGMLGKPDAAEISLQDTTDMERIFNGSAFNGDGVVPVEAAEDDATKAALQDIIDRAGAETDRSGKPGVSQASADRFFSEAALYAAWFAEADDRSQTALPLGDATAAAADTIAVLAGKLDDYFTRCRLAAFDTSAADALNPPATIYQGLTGEALAPARGEIAALPLAHIAAARALPLTEGINPAWATALDKLRREVVTPLLGERNQLSEEDWGKLKQTFTVYRDWMARKPATTVEALGIDRIRALTQPEVKAAVGALIAKDKALEPEMNAIAQVDKLVRLQRDLLALLNNVVAFRDFYTRHGKAMFQAGTLYLDGRSCDLCVKVADIEKHAQLATLSRIYLVYCRCTRIGEQMTVAAAFTAGSSDNLIVGRNGVFYDRKGRDWDATIVKIIEHPISLRQAFWLPYRQFAQLVGSQIQKMAAARAAAAQSQAVTTAVTKATEAPAAAPTAAAATSEAAAKEQAFDAAKFAGIFAAIGLAIGAIGTALASIITGFMHLTWWQMPLAILGIILLISGPSVLIAAMKLRSRNLGPILDACGWAVNTRLRVNIPFGTALTAMSQLPPGAQRSLADPYAEKRRPWGFYLFILILIAGAVVAWRMGYLAPLLQHLKSE